MKVKKVTSSLYFIQRISSLIGVILLFIPAINPSRISGLIGKNLSIFTSGFFYSRLTQNFGRAFSKGWVGTMTTQVLFISSMIICIGFILCVAGACLSPGCLKMKKQGNILSVIGTVLALIGAYGIRWAQIDIKGTSNPDKVQPMESNSLLIFMVLAILILLTSIALLILLPKPDKNEKYEMETKYKLFLLIMPFLILCFVFSYLPLFGWRYAFFDYKAGDSLSMDKFVGFKWFTYLFQNKSTRGDIVRVLRNTLAMSGLGLATSWCAMAFAIFLCEIKSLRLRRFIQTITTIPNFISWVLVFAVAFSIFSTDGFLSSILIKLGVMDNGVNYLMSNNHMWLKMLAWGMWKGLGWSAIIYVAAISGIDQQLFEAATVDGAGRFQRMWHITVPSLLPTFLVLLIMAVAGILSNGMDQYLVFQNAYNTETVTVLDLYVYKLGINNGKIPLATVVGMAKSIVSIILLFGANRVSKIIRGNSII